MSSPKKPKIVPADPDVKVALDEVADHPEITLSRREILRFILVGPAKRSDEIQAILKVEEIGETRGALNTAQNKLQTALRTATAQVESSREVLQRHLQIPAFQAAELLGAVNQRREALGLPNIEKLAADTKLDAGLAESGKTPEFNKQSALRDLKALSDPSGTFPDLGKAEATLILSGIARLEADSALLDALQKRSLIEKGLIGARPFGIVLPMPGDFISLAMRRYTLANCARLINVASSALARELLTRFETGHRCRKSFGAGFRYSMPASPFSQGSNCFSAKRTGIRSWTSATKPLGSVIIMVQDFSRSPVSRFFHSSHSPAIVSAGDPSRAVKYQGCFPPGMSCHS